jgi:hypothetical protein
MLTDYIGMNPSAPDAADVTFSLTEAAGLLRLPIQILRTLLEIPGLCTRYETTGRVSEAAVRRLYAKLNAR